jgi:phenylacetate-CoA ligase
MDNMTVHVEALAEAAHDEARTLSSKELAHYIKSVVGISTKINICGPGGVARSEGKATRIIDRRPKS